VYIIIPQGKLSPLTAGRHPERAKCSGVNMNITGTSQKRDDLVYLLLLGQKL